MSGLKNNKAVAEGHQRVERQRTLIHGMDSAENLEMKAKLDTSLGRFHALNEQITKMDTMLALLHGKEHGGLRTKQSLDHSLAVAHEFNRKIAQLYKAALKALLVSSKGPESERPAAEKAYKGIIEQLNTLRDKNIKLLQAETNQEVKTSRGSRSGGK